MGDASCVAGHSLLGIEHEGACKILQHAGRRDQSRATVGIGGFDTDRGMRIASVSNSDRGMRIAPETCLLERPLRSSSCLQGVFDV